MPTRQETIEYLRNLPEGEYSDLIGEVDAHRLEQLEQEEQLHPLPAHADRDTVARWIARRHLATDPSIIRIYYLLDAPPQVIRFLEINRLLTLPIPPNNRVTALHFGLDAEGADFNLFVADVTPEQLTMIQQGRLQLPEGWALEPHLVLGWDAE
jgi:hypothetical protein